MPHLEFPYRIVCTEENCDFDEEVDNQGEVVEKSQKHLENNTEHQITVLNLIKWVW